MGHNQLQVLFRVLPAKTYHSAVHVLNMKNSSRDSGFPGILYCISQLVYTELFPCQFTEHSIVQCMYSTWKIVCSTVPGFLYRIQCSYIYPNQNKWLYLQAFSLSVTTVQCMYSTRKNCLFYSAGFPISYCISQLDIIPCTVTVHATPTRTDMLAKVNYYMHGVYISIQ